MAPEETRLDAGHELSRPTRIAHLLNRLDAHEAEGLEIEAEQSALGLDKKQLRAIRATQKTLAALMGSDVLPAGASL